MSAFPPVLVIEIYKALPPRFRVKARRQPWRWRAFNEGNRQILASGESFTNYADCRSSVQQLFGDGSNTYLWKHDVPAGVDQSSETLRRAVPGE